MCIIVIYYSKTIDWFQYDWDIGLKGVKAAVMQAFEIFCI